MTNQQRLDLVSLNVETREMFVTDAAGTKHNVYQLNVQTAAANRETPEQKEMLSIAWDWIEDREVGRTDSQWGMKMRTKNGFIASARMLRDVNALIQKAE